MTQLARFLARRLWFGMLWFMRRGWMKRLQWAAVKIGGPKREAKRREAWQIQNAFARRIGLPLMTGLITVVLWSIVVTCSYYLILEMMDRGWIPMP
ncbi:MAG: hypothetical protein ABL949_10735 [Fimbriimonadaceae bacterium]